VTKKLTDWVLWRQEIKLILHTTNPVLRFSNYVALMPLVLYENWCSKITHNTDRQWFTETKMYLLHMQKSFRRMMCTHGGNLKFGFGERILHTNRNAFWKSAMKI
jgi:hypothetical protein